MADKHVWKIKTTRVNPKGEPIFYNFACQFATLESLVEALNNGKMIVGEMVKTHFKNDEKGEYLLVVGRSPCAIGPQAIGMIEPQTRRIVEEVEG